MMSLSQFLGAAEVAILSTEGDGLVRLKAALNALNTAQFSVKFKGTQICVESAVAMMAIGESSNRNRIEFMGHVILPWCRPSGRVEPVSLSRATSINIVMCHATHWGFKRVGEGHRTLYELVEAWWDHLRVSSLTPTDAPACAPPPLPWPSGDQTLPLVSDILRFRGMHRLWSSDSLLERLNHAEILLIVPVKWEMPDGYEMHVVVTWAFAIRECETNERPNDNALLKPLERKLRTALSQIVSFALRTPVSVVGDCDNEEGKPGEQRSLGAPLTSMSRPYLQLEQTLRETWADLAS